MRPSVAALTIRRSAIVLALWGWSLLSVSLPVAAATPAREPDLAAIDAYVEGTMRADNVPGLALAIVRGERVVHLRGLGVAGPGGRPVTPQTPFLLGSMSKSFTALAVMQLVEAGKLDLDAPVQRYLPWFRVASPEASAAITVRHLLHHTSGLPTRAPRAAGDDPSLEAHVRALAGVELDHAPGAAHRYASPNYQVLGLIVETVSGQPFGDYVRRRIFAPLGMGHSFTSRDEAVAAGLADGHQYWFGRPVAAALPYEGGRLPAASLIASAEDLGHYLIAHLNGERYGPATVISPAGLAELHRPAAAGDGFAYAMGWRVGPVRGVPAIHHGGALPHYRGKLVLLPGEGYGVVVLTNAASFLGRPTSHDIADGVAALLAGRAPGGTGLSLGRLYLLVTLGIAATTLGQLKGILTLRRWCARLGQRATAARGRFRREFAPLVMELAVPLLLLLGLPRLVGLPWPELTRQLPDLGSWVLISASVGLAVGLLKAAWAFTVLRRAAGALHSRGADADYRRALAG